MGLLVIAFFVLAPIAASPSRADLNYYCDDTGCYVFVNGEWVQVASDLAAPDTTIDLSPAIPDGSNGWYVSNVHVTVTATDDTAGVDKTNCVLDPTGAPPPPASFDDIPDGCAYTSPGGDVTSDGIHNVYAASNDNAGNKETPVSVSFKIDKTHPTVTCGVAPTFAQGAAATITATVSDSTSGATATSVSAIADTSTVGSKTVALTGSDFAGNQTIVNCGYSVAYSFSGFFQPVNNLTLNPVKAGSAVAVKFSLTGNQGLVIFASGYPKSEQLIACDSSNPAGGEETVTAGSSSLSYDAVTDRYSFNWKTNKAWANTCRQLVITLTDGTTHRANFMFTK